MIDIIKVAAYWKIYNRTGMEIDAVENTLRQISGAPVTRTETSTDADIYDATYCLKGEVDAQRFADACHFMADAGAYPY